MVATLTQKMVTVKDVPGMLRYSRTAATTTDIYTQGIPEGVRGTIDSIHRELTKSPKPNGSGSGSKKETSLPIEKKMESGGGKTGVQAGRTLQERRNASDFKTRRRKVLKICYQMLPRRERRSR